jgi:hypothetical protein
MPDTSSIIHEKVERLKAGLGDEVDHLEVETGTDSEGEPAVWVWIVLRSDASEHSWSWENREKLRTHLLDRLRKEGVDQWVYVRFRDAAELTNHQ